MKAQQNVTIFVGEHQIVGRLQYKVVASDTAKIGPDGVSIVIDQALTTQNFVQSLASTLRQIADDIENNADALA